MLKKAVLWMMAFGTVLSLIISTESDPATAQQ